MMTSHFCRFVDAIPDPVLDLSISALNVTDTYRYGGRSATLAIGDTDLYLGTIPTAALKPHISIHRRLNKQQMEEAP
jgi:hypothetical protein